MIHKSAPKDLKFSHDAVIGKANVREIGTDSSAINKTRKLKKKKT